MNELSRREAFLLEFYPPALVLQLSVRVVDVVDVMAQLICQRARACQSLVLWCRGLVGYPKVGITVAFPGLSLRSAPSKKNRLAHLSSTGSFFALVFLPILHFCFHEHVRSQGHGVRDEGRISR
jgi:hypothetical protein